MKLIRLFFAIICYMICLKASAEIDVGLLTQGGWDCGAKWCYFFEADGNCDIVGDVVVHMKWTFEPDGCLRIFNTDGNVEYAEIAGLSMRWRDGRNGYHRPFAEKSNEISIRRGRESPDLTWHAPHSANMLADKFYSKSWLSDTKDAAMYFFSPDTCVISDIARKNLNQKYLWQAIDAESVKLTALQPPYGDRIIKIKMYPDAFDFADTGVKKHYILNAYYKTEALAAAFDMCYIPLGCHGFFTERPDEVKSYFDRTFSGHEGVGAFSIYIVGHLWTCDSVIITQKERQVSYVNRPGDNAAIDKSFQYMSIILNNLFIPAENPMEDNICSFIARDPGGRAPLFITLIKGAASDRSEDSVKNGFVSLTIRTE